MACQAGLGPGGFHRAIGTTCLALSALALCACASGPRGAATAAAPAPPPVMQVPAYQSAHHAVQRASERWVMAGQALPVVITGPVGGSSGPLLLYLPGLGEAADSGERWCRAWAAAGYTVLAVQALADDAQAWQSDAARSGEFMSLAKAHHGSSAMRRRLDAIVAILGEARKRGQQGHSLLAAAQGQGLVLAGHDLGAHTVMVAAGEHMSGLQAPDWQAAGWQLQALIVLSPHVEPPADSPRYAAVQVPVLMVTSTADADPAGLLTSPLDRALPFDLMASNPRYLMMLDGLPHAALAGQATVMPPAGAHPDASAATADATARSRRGGDGNGRARQGSGGSHGRVGDEGEGRAQPTGRREDGPAKPAARPRPPLGEASAQLRVTSAAQLSSVFLDAWVRQVPAARQWLDEQAANWLGPIAELEHR